MELTKFLEPLQCTQETADQHNDDRKWTTAIVTVASMRRVMRVGAEGDMNWP